MHTFFIISALWFLSEVLLNIMLRSGKEDKKSRDKGSLRIIWITITMSITLAVLASIYLPFRIDRTLLVPYTGMILIICGIVIRFMAVLSLGRFFTVNVTIRKNHTLKKDGIYKRIRHPSYSGAILSFIGLGMSLNNWLSLAVVAIPVTMAMLYRINIEEQLLARQFGKEYQNYKTKTKRLIPFIY